MTTNATNDAESADSHWSHRAILNRVDTAGWTDGQRAAFAVAIRNPDASRVAIDREAGVTDREGSGVSTIGNLLWSIEYGLAGSIGGGEKTGYTLDFPIPDTQGFGDRTAKQKAVIDFYARHPNAREKLSHKAAAAGIFELYGVPVHYNTIAAYKRKWPDVLAKRRERYESEGLIEEVTAEQADEWSPKPDDIMRPVRGDLAKLGYDLPDENLDGLPTIEDARREGVKRGAEIRKEKADSTQKSVERVAEYDAKAKRVTRTVGSRSYEGPEGGLDLTGGGSAKVLAPKLRSERVGEELAEEFDRVREENGPYGEEAFMRRVEIEDKDDLVEEIRHLRMIVSTQGALIHDLRDALEHMRLDVGVRFDRPEVSDE